MKLKTNVYGGINDMPHGWRHFAPENKKIYEMWRGMLRRCDSRYKDAIYQGCTCHKDFYYLSKFYAWIVKEPRYNEFINDLGSHKWAIDKDMIEPGNKEYTYGKIQLITFSANSRDAASRIDYKLRSVNNAHIVDRIAKKHYKPILRINITNPTDMRIYESLKEAVADGFNHAKISNCCNGHIKSYKGYRWVHIKREVL